MRGGANPVRRAQLLERFDLDPTKKSRTYSKGNRQKVALIAALASDVDLLLLDEPTSGLDPLMESEFRAVVRERVAEGVTVLLSSHILSEAESLSDRVSIIRGGHVVESGTLAQLRHLTRTAVTVDLATAPSGLAEIPGVHGVQIVAHEDGTRVTCEADASALDALLTALSGSGVRALTSTPPTLEELFLRHYSDALASTSTSQSGAL